MKVLFLALTLATALPVASATTFRELSLAQLIGNDELGFLGTVSGTVVEARATVKVTSV